MHDLGGAEEVGMERECQRGGRKGGFCQMERVFEFDHVLVGSGELVEVYSQQNHVTTSPLL